MPKKLTTEEFIEKAIEIHGYCFDYSNVEYTKSSIKVNIYCKKHNYEFMQTPNAHLRGQGCPKCSNNYRYSTIDIVKMFSSLYGNKYDYSLVDYKNMKTKIKIICDKGHMFEQTPDGHLSGKGCMFCSGKSMDNKSIIERFKYIHGDKYDYSLVNYIDAKTKVIIYCHKHGYFNQTPSGHLSGKGCSGCKNLKLSIISHSWSISRWAKLAECSKNFDSFKVYVIRCWNDNEEFYKIGRTYTKTKYRFSGSMLMPYNYEILHEIVFNKNKEMIDNARDCFNKENELKRVYKNFKYIPFIDFGGKHECFINLPPSAFCSF